jgi:carboxypeptidase T
MKSARIIMVLLALVVAATLVMPPAGNAQERWSKVRITVPDRESLHELIRMGVNFEGSRGNPGGPIECTVSADVLDRLRANGISPEVLIDDLAAFYASRLAPGPVNALGFGTGSMGGFFTLNEIAQQLDSLRLLYPNVVGAKDSIGASLQGRAIWAVRVTANPDVASDRPQVLYFAQQHANEPIGMMVLLFFMHYLAERYGVDPEVTYLLDNRDLWFVPIVNVDAYEANRRMQPGGGGMRRKNMRGVITDNDVRGVDLNRNWDAEWGLDDLGSSPNPMDWDYRGTAPFSEPETQVLSSFCWGKSFRFSMEYHAYWNTVFTPPGYDMTIETADSLLFRAYIRELTRQNHYSNGMTVSSYPSNGYGSDWLYENPPPAGKHFPFLVEVGSDVDGVWPATGRLLPLALENVPANLFAAWAGGAFPKMRQAVVVDSSGDGDLEPGEAFTLQIDIHNFGQDPASMTSVEVSSAGRFLDIPTAPLLVAHLEAHADSLITIAGRVAPDAVEGFEDKLVVSVNPVPQIEFRDTVSVVLGTSQTIFADDAEQGPSNWTMELDWGLSGVAHAGTSSFSDSPGRNYRNGTTGRMTLVSPVTLPRTATVTRLQFWARWNTEPGYDYAEVFVSTDGGGTWASVHGSHASWWHWKYVYTGYEPFWLKEDIDLSEFAGQDVLLRFQLSADGVQYGDGIYVDDIVIKSYTATGSRLQKPPAIEFPPVAVGEKDTMALILRNLGTNPLVISDFIHWQNVIATIGPGALPWMIPGTLDSTTVNVMFEPVAHGPIEDTLLIASNDPTRPEASVPLSGFGVLLGEAEGGRLYATSTSPTSSLFTLDLASAETTTVGGLGVKEIIALAVHPETRVLYGIAQPSNLLELYRLSSPYGQTVPTATIALPGSRAMAFSPTGALYIGTATGRLYRVELPSGDTTLVGTDAAVKYSALAFHPTTGELWGADLGGTKDMILKVDTTTGRATAVGRTWDSQNTLSLTFDAEGTLYALKGSPYQKNRLVRIDQSNGSMTIIDTTNAVGILAIVMQSIGTGVVSEPFAGIPVSYSLEQNYPNPFNPATRIQFAVASRRLTALRVYDVLGQEVTTLLNEVREPGVYSVSWDATHVASGVYFYRLTAGDFVQTRKMVLLR